MAFDSEYTTSAPAFGIQSSTFADAMKVRIAVYVDEQSVPLENEQDDDDDKSWHWVVYSSSSQPVATIRIVCPPHGHAAEGPDPDKEPKGEYLKVGRLATIKEARGKGIAKQLVGDALQFVQTNKELPGDGRLLAHAQKVVVGFWEGMGFTVAPEMGEWVEEGIMHVGMWWTRNRES